MTINFAGLQWCDFVAYTNKGKFVERVLLDTDLWNGLKLIGFYSNHAVGYFLSNDNGVVSSDPRPSTYAEYDSKWKRYFRELTYRGDLKLSKNIHI